MPFNIDLLDEDDFNGVNEEIRRRKRESVMEYEADFGDNSDLPDEFYEEDEP